jgi:hypothetical protein
LSLWWGLDLDSIFGADGDEPEVNEDHLPERDEPMEPDLVGHPTFALPGTKEKVEVMRYRFENGLQIFNPQDATYDAGESPLSSVDRSPRFVKCRRGFGIVQPDGEEESL